MALESYCSQARCSEKRLKQKYAIPVSYVCAAIALAAPITNSMGASVNSTLAYTSFNFSVMTLILFFVWIISGIVAGLERHQNMMMCVIHSLGIPGVTLALLTIGQS